jgi:DNA-cytosine methyltransferase
MNFPETRVIVSDASKVDVSTLEPVDVLFASPPCQAHSTARSKKLAPRDDADAGLCVIDYLKALRPRRFFLENVEGYKRSGTFKAIVSALHELGYFTDQQVLNAADYGVPQTRRRLILRASREGFPAPLPKKVKWVGWYEAIEDLIPTLPESKFAPWQIKRLETSRTCVVNGTPNDHGKSLTQREENEPTFTVVAQTGQRQAARAFIARSTDQLESVRIARDEDEPIWTLTNGNTSHGMPKAFLVESKNANQQWGDGLRAENEPATTVVTDDRPSHMPKAFILDGRNTRTTTGEPFTLRETDEPCFTVTAADGSERNRAFVEGMPTRQPTLLPPSGDWHERGRVVAMTPRALARFQSIPDDINLPANNGLACKVIGNAIPPGLAEPLIAAEMQAAEVLPLTA